MIFNCESCGKSISSKKDFCPYCKCDTAEFSLTLEKRKLFGIKSLSGNLKEKIRGTFASIRY
jgi:hypothetical protein